MNNPDSTLLANSMGVLSLMSIVSSQCQEIWPYDIAVMEHMALEKLIDNKRIETSILPACCFDDTPRLNNTQH